MSPIDELAAEINRHLNAEAGGDPWHPGARLRVLLLWHLSEGEQRDQLGRDIDEAGFMPWPDKFNPGTGNRFCSVGAVARAVGVHESVMQAEIDRFLASDIARRLGFRREVLFPEGDECTALH